VAGHMWCGAGLGVMVGFRWFADHGRQAATAAELSRASAVVRLAADKHIVVKVRKSHQC
jgi:hypothetical protein